MSSIGQSLTLAAQAIAVVTGLLLTRFLYEIVRDRRLPPGPKRWPFIGNLYQARKGEPIWIFLKELAEKYGPIYSVQVWDTTCIVVADQFHFNQILEKRGTNYSDRPKFVQANNLYQGRHILLRDYDGKFKERKKCIKPVLDSRSAQAYAPVHQYESNRLLMNLLNDDDFSKSLHLYPASTICTLAYGHRVDSDNDDLTTEIYGVQDNTRKAFTLGTWAVDFMPSLNWLPKPLAPWKQTAEQWQHKEEAMRQKHMNAALQSGGWTWAKQLVAGNRTIDKVELAYDLGIMVDAGIEPTTAVLHVFIMAAILFPDFVHTAQQELDGVVGPNRLPTLGDREKLVYVQYCMQEVFRWRSVLPLAFPHQSHNQDEYMGYRIPAGSTIVPLQWHHNLNPSIYPDPHSFKPERWEAGCPEYYAFGFGLRACPGLHVSKDSIFSGMASILWAFNISAVEGKVPVVDDKAWSTGFLTMPPKFEAKLTPRSSKHATVIQRQWTKGESDVDGLLAQVERNLPRR